jgi:hypothetical protein
MQTPRHIRSMRMYNSISRMANNAISSLFPSLTNKNILSYIQLLSPCLRRFHGPSLRIALSLFVSSVDLPLSSSFDREHYSDDALKPLKSIFSRSKDVASVCATPTTRRAQTVNRPVPPESFQRCQPIAQRVSAISDQHFIV